MKRIVIAIDRGQATGKFSARVSSKGSILNVGTFATEELANAFLSAHDDEYFEKAMTKRKRSVKFDRPSWDAYAKAQRLEMSYKYVFMTGRLSAKEQKAIKRFCDDYNMVPQLSVFPMIRFKSKSDGSIVEKHLQHLVMENEVANKEDQKTRADEKKRLEREEKWKPNTGRYS